MPYFDIDEDQEQTPAAEAEARRKVLGMIAGARKPAVLGNREPDTSFMTFPKPGGGVETAEEARKRLEDSAMGGGATSRPDPRYYHPYVGDARPRIPAPRVPSPMEPPVVMGAPPSLTSKVPILGGTTRPERPNVAPSREDYPAKPEVGGWRKYLGLGLATLSGPQTAGPLAEKILHGQRDIAEEKYQRGTQDWERTQSDAARAATTAHTLQETKNLINPPQKEGLTPEETTIHDLMTGDNGKPRINPETKQPYDYLGAYTTVMERKQGGKQGGKPSFEEQSYAEWLPTHPGGTRMQFEKERAANTQKPERPQRTLVTVPQPDGSAKVIEAQPGMVIPKGARTVQEFGKEQAPTADEQRRADLANNLNEQLDRLEEIVTRRPDLFGPFAGRGTSVRQWTGTSDPDVAALATIKEQTGMAMVGTHAMRNAQHVEKAADSILNAYKNQPSALLGPRGSLAAARASLKTFIGDVQGQRVQDKTQKPAVDEKDPLGILK